MSGGCKPVKVDGVTVIACSRGGERAPIPCSNCPVQLAQEICDGCDKGLCARCAVSPRPGVDFCPMCFRPLFVAWCSSPEGKRWESGAAALKLNPEALRDLRRNVFRKWSTHNAAAFEQIRSAHSRSRGAPAIEEDTFAAVAREAREDRLNKKK